MSAGISTGFDRTAVTTLTSVSPRPGAASSPGSSTPGEIDYRLARAARLGALRRGELSRLDVCDAQPELMRNAEACSTTTRRKCPVCDERPLVEVTYVFGPRLPPSGRCITSRRELARLAAKAGRFEAYIVEVCRACRWNHLTRSYPLATDAGAR